MDKGERLPRPYNPFIKMYGGIGRLAVNTIKVVAHEINPPKPQSPPINRSEIRILDDERAVIEVQE